MSTVKTNNLQIGQSLTATNNGTWYQPSTPDGTIRYGIGNAGATTSDVVTLTSAGNVGIGTSSPGSKLTVVGSVSGSSAANGYDAYTASRASRTFCWGLDASGNYGIWDTTSGVNNRLLIDSSGNLGLGVTPKTWATVVPAMQIGNTGYATYANRVYIGANWYYNSGDKYITTDYACLYIQAVGKHQWYTAPSGTAGNAISFTQAMTLDASGNLLVGTTTYSATPQGFAAVVGAGTYLDVAHANGVASGSYYQIYRYNGGLIGSITQNGTTGVLYNITSDQRLKTNVQPAESAIQSILDFPVDQFDWIADGTHQDFGAIAQKAHKIIPEMVSVPADPEEMWGIDWSKAVPRLIRAYQELSAELNELKAKVNA